MMLRWWLVLRVVESTPQEDVIGVAVQDSPVMRCTVNEDWSCDHGQCRLRRVDGPQVDVGVESDRMLLAEDLLTLRARVDLVGRNASSSRYVGIISNLDGSLPVPTGLYFLTRIGAVTAIVDGRKYSMGRLFRQAAFFAPSLESSATLLIGTVVDDYADAHNLNAIIVGSRVVAIGGGRAPGNEKAIVHAYEASMAAVLAGHWLTTQHHPTRCERRTIAFDGGLDSCVEKRHNAVTSNEKKFCFFDGKHSLVVFRGTYFLYSRANLQHHGGRFLQVTSAPSVQGPWSPFVLVDFLDFDERANAGDQFSGNIYYAAVNPNPVVVGNTSTLLGLFPLMRRRNGHDEGFITMSLSCDGYHWAKMTRILSVPHVIDGRPIDMPVDGIIAHGNRLFLYVQRNVPGVAPHGHDTYLVRYEIHHDALARYTAFSIRKLRCEPGVRR